MKIVPRDTPPTVEQETDPDISGLGEGDRIETEDARGGQSVGLWKILAGSMILVVLGFALMAGLSSR
jgi:hypothetical protein